MNTQSGSAPEVRRYVVHPFYKILAMICILVAAGMSWELGQDPSPGALLFFGVTLSIASWSILAAFSRVELTPSGICLTTLLHGCRCVDFRQLVSVTENGRLNPVITLVYHPRLESGLLDLDRVEPLQLPAVTDQAALLAHLQARTPV